jgi:hypothetical protein
VYTSGASLGELLASLAVELVRSSLGHREVVLTFAAESTDRMDRMAEVARLSGAYVFTGAGRYFVQYRDAAAPFGYDLAELAPDEAPLFLAHTQFSQHYQPERRIDLRALLLRLEPRPAPARLREHDGSRWLCAEAGLGPALVHYFVRSKTAAEVGVAEWPPASGFETEPVRRHLLRLAALPARMVPLFTSTPGITVYEPSGPGVAVEIGFTHALNLRACPLFDEEGLVLLHGRGRAPLVIEKLPVLGPVESFARVELGSEREAPAAGRASTTSHVHVPVRLAPHHAPPGGVRAAHVGAADLDVLRALSYRLGRSTLADTRIAFAAGGAYLVHPHSIEPIPVGELFRQVHPNVFVSAGSTALPDVAPEVLHRALGAPQAELVFLHRGGARVGVPASAFTPLAEALIGAETWARAPIEPVAEMDETELPVVELPALGVRPLREVELPATEGGDGPE